MNQTYNVKQNFPNELQDLLSAVSIWKQCDEKAAEGIDTASLKRLSVEAIKALVSSLEQANGAKFGIIEDWSK